MVEVFQAVGYCTFDADEYGIEPQIFKHFFTFSS